MVLEMRASNRRAEDLMACEVGERSPRWQRFLGLWRG